MRWRAVLLLIVAWVDCPGRAADSDDAGRTADEQTLRAKGFKTDSLSLLRFFHARTLTPEKEEVYFAKVKQLGDTSYRVRNQATADLVKAGEQVRPVLQEVLKEGKYSLEILRRVELCLRQVSETDEEDVALAAARLIARSKPAGAAQVLLDYLPNASDERVVEEVRKALAAVAVRGGRAEETVLQALTDKRPIRRAAAGEALVRAGDKGQRQAARPLLEDPAPQVRLQVAHALAEAKEKSAVPVLIRLLAELPAEQVWEVEELLIRLAGEKSPNVFVDRDTATAKVRDAWLAWWNANQATVDLARLTENPGLLGYTLITQMDKGTTGRVLELKPNNEVHWEIDGLRYPFDAQVIGKDRVLVAEYLNRRVTERDFKGRILWEKQVDTPIACQRLANGHTFIATRRQLLVVDKAGKEVFSYAHRNTSISAARRLRDGQMVVVSSGGLLHRLDARGNEVKSFKVGAVYTLGGSIDALPNGRVLVPQYRDNLVVEYDADGRAVWQASVPLPTSAVRLPGGNTLVTSMGQSRIVELDRNGKEVWNYPTEGRPWRARRR